MPVLRPPSAPCVQILVAGEDTRGNPLLFSGRTRPVRDDLCLTDFRLNKGDGLEFKRAFQAVCTATWHTCRPGARDDRQSKPQLKSSTGTWATSWRVKVAQSQARQLPK